MKKWLACGVAAVGLVLCLDACGGQPSGEDQTPSASPVVETPTPIPAPTPMPTPTLTPMEQKYSDFDPQGTQLQFAFLDDPGVALGREDAERALTQHLYGTWYWEDTDTPFTITEETIDDRTYYVHAVKEVAPEALAALITYADDPEMLYQLETYPYGTDPLILMVKIESLNEGPDGYLYVGYEYSQTELDQIYAEWEETTVDYEDYENYGDYGDSEQENTVPDGTVAYFRFATEIGKYQVENGQYVLKKGWTWTNNEVIKWDNNGRPTVRDSNNSLPPVEDVFFVCLPKSFSASDCPYEPCPAETVNDSYSNAMIFTHSNGPL